MKNLITVLGILTSLSSYAASVKGSVDVFAYPESLGNGASIYIQGPAAQFLYDGMTVQASRQDLGSGDYLLTKESVTPGFNCNILSEKARLKTACYINVANLSNGQIAP